MSEIETLIEFKKQLINFFDELISQFPIEGDLVVMRLFITTQMCMTTTTNKFIYELDKNNGDSRKAIKERNDMYFLNCDLNTNTQEKFNLSHFRKLWRSGVLDSEDKRVIWQWVDTFVFLADKYIKSKIN